MGRLENKVAIVTGAASGIGQATAKIMAREGAKIIVADANRAGAEAVAFDIRALGGTATPITFDALEPASIKDLITTAPEIYGKLDILHSNVGGTDPAKDLDVEHMDLDCWDWVFRLCLKSAVVGAKYAIPLMAANGGGSIINTASMSGSAGDLTNTAYGVSKSAVMMLTRYIATQVGDRNIRCNCVAPSVTMTPAVEQHLPRPIQEAFRRQTPLARFATPEEIGNAVTFLASDEAAFITGQIIEVDGGMRAHLPTTPDMAAFLSQ